MDRNYEFGFLLCFSYFKSLRLGYEKNQETQERVRKCVETLQEKVIVKTEADIYQKYIIIDNRLVWYGSIGLLDDVNPDDTIIRLEARELVRELTIATPR